MADHLQGVYTITNTRAGSVYVGSSSHVENRWLGHHQALNSGRGANRALLADWQEFGATMFAFVVVEVFAGVDSQALAAAEQRWIDHYRGEGVTLYNRLPASPHFVIGAMVPDGFVSLPEDGRRLWRAGSQANHYRLVHAGRLAVHRFPEPGPMANVYIGQRVLGPHLAHRRGGSVQPPACPLHYAA